MVEFEGKGDKLFINGREVAKAWESSDGFFLFGVEKAWEQDSIVDGKVIENDQIWYGYVQGLEEWAYFSEGRLKRITTVREIPKKELPYFGRRTKTRTYHAGSGTYIG